MKKIYICFFLLMTVITPQLYAQLSVTSDTTICIGSPLVLQAVVSGGFGTENYVFEEIAYSPEEYSGTSISLMDDDFSGPYEIGFDFCFFGETYTEFYFGSNGWISFGPEASLTAVYTSEEIPSTATGIPKNCIMGPWEDWHPGLCSDDCLLYETIGTAPNRKLVISYKDVPMFFCTTTIGKFQIVINETSSIVENHLTEKPNCPDWAGGTGTEGVHNEPGTLAFTVPGRNSTEWTTENESIRFVPSGITWFEGATEIGYSDTISVFPTATTTYTAVVTLCDGTTYSEDVVVTVSEINETITITDVLCNGDTNGSASIAITGPNPPFSYDWSTGVTTTSITGVVSGDYTVTVQDAEGCVKTFTIPINEPEELLVPIEDIVNATCFGYPDGEATIAAVGGIDPYTYVVNGTTSLNDNLSGLVAGSYAITVTDANGCVAETTFTITQPDALSIDLGADQTIILGASATIEAVTDATDIIGISWAPDGGFFPVPCDDPCYTYTVSPIYSTTYYVGISNLEGCSAIDTIRINVEYIYEVFFPSAFSPNGDGLNDFFQGIAFNVVDYNFNIYNRWGELVYTTTRIDYASGWNGLINGEPAALGSYVFTVNAVFAEGQIFNDKGSFILVK